MADLLVLVLSSEIQGERRLCISQNLICSKNEVVRLLSAVGTHEIEENVKNVYCKRKPWNNRTD